jgi:hypothetical protein
MDLIEIEVIIYGHVYWYIYRLHLTHFVAVLETTSKSFTITGLGWTEHGCSRAK